MFTGLITKTGTVQALDGHQFSVSTAADPEAWEIGESIAIDGCCLTLVSFQDSDGFSNLNFDVSPETLARTIIGQYPAGKGVHLERSARVGDRIGGHVVSGHVDGVGVCVKILDQERGFRVLGFEISPEIARYLVPKGSIAVNGVSLTVVSPESSQFEVHLIPETLRLTNLSSIAIGSQVNIEIDAMAKAIHAQVEASLSHFLAKSRILEEKH